MVKYNLGGAAIGESRTSSIMLFGDDSKKRTKKANEKVVGDGAKSIISSKSKN
jgi:hypothetical protein